MWLPSPLPWLLVCLLSATFPPWGAATAPPRRTEVPGGGATRSSSSSRLGDLLVSHEPGQPMTQRALSVLVLASAVLIAYFVIRSVRLRRQNRKTRRYGVLDTNIENMQLTPLE